MIPILNMSDAAALKARVMNRSQLQDEEISCRVKEIVNRVREEGDAALFEYTARFDKADIKTALEKFLLTFDPADDMNAWFDKVKAIAREIGYADDMKVYKADPSAFRGNVADVSMFLRVAVTGKLNSPDMYAVMQVLGDARVRARIEAMINSL